MIVLFPKNPRAFRHRARSQIRPALNHHPRRFTAGVRIDYMNPRQTVTRHAIA
jgi:hypothetical protein